MAEKIYVGARYVPKFATPISYNSALPYEYLTVVEYNGSYFTSKKPVPAGITPSNSNYWAATGNYNAQVEIYRQQAEAADEAAILSKSLATKKRVVLIGDGYGTNNGGGAVINETLPYKTNSYLGLPAEDFYSSFANDAGFCNGGFLSLLSALVPSVTDPETITDIYVLGGLKDEYNTEGVTQSGFNEAVSAFKSAAITAFPNAKINIGFIAWKSSGFPTNLNTTRTWFLDVDMLGCSVISNLQWVMHNPSYFVTSTNYPNQYGVNALAKSLADVIMTGDCNVYYSFTSSFADWTLYGSVEKTSNGDSSLPQIITTVNNAFTRVFFYVPSDNFVITYTSSGDPTTFSCYWNAGELNMFNVPNTPQSYNNQCVIPLPVHVYGVDNAYKGTWSCKIKLLSGKFTLIPPYAPNTPAMAMSKFALSSCSTVIPTVYV